MTQRPIHRALVSVSDKTGLVELGQALVAAGIEIVSTGSTASTLQAAGVAVTAVADVTGFPETLDGRVKTLHPKVHGGLLADVRKPEHVAALEELEIAPFDLLVVNLYPFAQTVQSGAGIDECVENIDIGGPAMVRAAAKNYANVAVVVSPARYEAIITAINTGGTDITLRAELAADAFAHTAAYDAAVTTWMGKVVSPANDSHGFARVSAAVYDLGHVLRYGENPHQSAALYVSRESQRGLASARQLQGKAMSYNNYVDADSARRAAYDHSHPAVAIIKHANPCGIAIGETITEAYKKAFATDPVSAFGGVVATNREVDADMAREMVNVFTEVVIAPAFTDEAVTIMSSKPSVRLLQLAGPHMGHSLERRQISGGMLAQVLDDVEAEGDSPSDWRLVSGEALDDATLADLEFAWRAVRAPKSNAILLASDGAAVGIGMGQVNRVDAARLAVLRAGERAAGSVAASDAFFPFPDGLEVLLEAGVRAVVQPGGSVRDEEVIEAARRTGVTMYLTGTRHFSH
jgi:phosphoribosylaminoimidazolecarboxamide formyltransferase / IMP cyclohydrolase